MPRMMDAVRRVETFGATSLALMSLGYLSIGSKEASARSSCPGIARIERYLIKAEKTIDPGRISLNALRPKEPRHYVKVSVVGSGPNPAKNGMINPAEVQCSGAKEYVAITPKRSDRIGRRVVVGGNTDLYLNRLQASNATIRTYTDEGLNLGETTPNAPTLAHGPVSAQLDVLTFPDTIWPGLTDRTDRTVATILPSRYF